MIRSIKRNVLSRTNKRFNKDLFNLFSGIALACTFSIMPGNANRLLQMEIQIQT